MTVNLGGPLGSVALFLGVLAAPLMAAGQPRTTAAHIGVLGATSPSAYAPFVEAFRQGLRDLGYVEGKTIRIDYRWAEGKYDRLPDLASELVRLKVDVIVTHGTPGTQAAKHATRSIPIVMAVAGDAVATGLVASIVNPGGNVTGSSFSFPELVAKRLELLKEALPRASRMGILLNPGNPANRPVIQALGPAAAFLKVELQHVEVRAPEELEDALARLARRRVDGVAIVDDAMLIANARRLAELAMTHRLPTIGFREYVGAGGLMAYGVNFQDLWHRAAAFVDKILKGARPADLHLEQPAKFELLINAKTAKALGLTLPPSLLLRADEVGP